MELPLKSQQGESVGRVEVRDDVFGAPSNKALVHQVIVGQLANRRVGTVSTKKPVPGVGRRQEAEASEGHGRRQAGFYPLSALQGRRSRLRSFSTQLPPEDAAENASAGPRGIVV